MLVAIILVVVVFVPCTNNYLLTSRASVTGRNQINFLGVTSHDKCQEPGKFNLFL